MVWKVFAQWSITLSLTLGSNDQELHPADWHNFFRNMNVGHEVLELKQQGNKFFSQRSYEEAISCYTKAIVSSFDMEFDMIYSRVCVTATVT